MDREREIRERSNAATSGPWIVGDGNKATMWSGANTVLTEDGKYVVMDRAVYTDEKEFNEQVFANIRFVAYARMDVPYLLDRNLNLESELETAKRQIADLRKLATAFLSSTVQSGCPVGYTYSKCHLAEKPQTMNFDPTVCPDCWVDCCISKVRKGGVDT